ncbi:MAG TPA: polyphosphate kinase 2 family protein [Usitatibacteraceae bacterium]
MAQQAPPLIDPRLGFIEPIVADSKTRLAKIDPRSTCGFTGEKEDAVAALAILSAELAALQDVLYAEHRHKVLVVLQAMDTGGKDGVLKKVFLGMNPQGLGVVSYKVPTALELDRDYLWRIHQHVPARGEIVVFNRSHYEDVLVTRVHGQVDDAVARRRFRQIKDFERMLVEEGVTILKFFLHISRDEQKQRLQDRLDDATKRWKFNPGDIEERKHWDDYQRVYEEAICATSVPQAPWYIVPADRKWLRDIHVSVVLLQTLRALNMRYPAGPPELDGVRIE